MGSAAPPIGRATLDFRSAQVDARRRTALLLLFLALAVALVILVVYVGLLAFTAAFGPTALLLGGADPRLLQPGLLLGTAAAVVAVTGVGGAYHAMRLAGGGGDAVAAMLGGRPIDRTEPGSAEHRLVNVTEEMAVAAGLPVPRLYLLAEEPAINAFAAGYTPGHCVIGVTRGALERLGRDELQGVVAHEMSHLLHGDTRLDLHLMEAVGGLTFLTLVGRLLLRGRGSYRGWGRRDSGAMPFLGLALFVAGSVGALCGKLVRFAVARQREWLADASAVQFTRLPDGLAGALRISAAPGSAVASPHAPEAAHLFFASAATGWLSGLFSTHPPIEERIRRIAPWAGEGGARPPGAPAGARPPAAPPPPMPTARHLAQAVEGMGRLPPGLVAAAREPFGARAVACGLLLAGPGEGREGQIAALAARDGALAAELRRIAPSVDGVGRTDRTALLGLALPSLDRLSPIQARALEAELRALPPAAGRSSLFEWAVRRAVLRRLAREPGRPPRATLRTLDDAQPDLLELLSTVARTGARDEAAAQAALAAGLGALGVAARWRLLPEVALGSDRLDSILSRLDGAAPALKGRILAACRAIAFADERLTPDEAELLRAVAASLGQPMAPLLADRP